MWMSRVASANGELVGFHLLEGGEDDVVVEPRGVERRKARSVARRSRGSRFADSFAPSRIRHAAQVAQVPHRLPGREALGDLDDVLLAHAVDDEVGLAVEQDRAADGVAPVVVVGQPPQRRLDAAGDDRHAGERLAGAVAVRRAWPGRGAGRSGRRANRRRRCGPSCWRCSG